VDQQQQSRWRPTRRQVLWAGGIAVVLTSVVLIGYRYGITLWDWIKILIVPAAIAIGVAWLNWAQERERQAQQAHREREREAEAEQREREREATEEARREREREAQAAQRERELEVENQRAQDAALEAYLDRMSQMLTDKERPLRRAQPGDNLSVVARAWTLTALKRFDAAHNRSVLTFLQESRLVRTPKPVFTLRSANLKGTDLGQVNLTGVDLTWAQLEEADLRGAILTTAILRNTRLRASANRLATFHTWQLSERFNSLPVVP
jgi:hypothetical protein